MEPGVDDSDEKDTDEEEGNGDTDVRPDIGEGQVDPSELVTEEEAEEVMGERAKETVVRVNQYFNNAAEASYRAGSPSFKQVDVDVVQTDKLAAEDKGKPPSISSVI